jgi:putative DNA primase/helicase
LVTASETEEGRAWAESRLKQLTGGDSIAARYMRHDFFEFIPEFKLVFLGNHKPILHNVDNAIRRRFNLIPFTHKPTHPDQKLLDKLKIEFPGILNWMLAGCLDWQRNGLTQPKIVKQATEEYFNDQDAFGHWLAECTERKYETTGETSGRLFASWKSWAKTQGENPGTKVTFSERMGANGYKQTRHTPGHRNHRGFLGISLNVKSDDFAPYSD